MDATPLYNLSPLASLLLVGALLAGGPVAWVLRRNRAATPQQRRQALWVFTLFLTFDLVLFGAFTRLTDSGLGCPDWPGCYGNTSPLGATKHIVAAQSLLPDGPVTHAKAWIEMLHRYLATGVGALITLLAVLSWRDWRHQRTQPGSATHSWPWLPSVTLLWVCLQGAFGALTVTMKLFPAIVTLHLLGALGLLVLLCLRVVWGADQPSPASGVQLVAHALPAASVASTASAQPPVVTVPRRLLAWSMGLLLLQIALGGWVSTNYAVLACSDFPTCQGRWWPEMDFRQGFELWRGLGLTAAGVPVSFAALTAIHYVHRLVAYVVLMLLMVLAWQLNRSKTWRLPSRVLAALLGLQLATGLSNVVLGWPLLAALLHTGGAAALLLTLTWVAARIPWYGVAAVLAGQPSAPEVTA
jgi:cytochrome c oxidase assembly protein subunit 15